jgi:hypothetical protein
MAKKVTQTLKAHLAKNTIFDKGGAWLLEITIQTEGHNIHDLNTCTAWANPSAAKRYLKSVVLDNTPRKSIKMAITTSNADTGKPLTIDGELIYKVDAGL